jgi:uncharacterized radical SAM superfamily Fe-S cluster-containing enzyme
MLTGVLTAGTSHEQCNMACDSCLIIAAQKQEAYLKSQMGTVSGTIENFEQKKRLHANATH